MKRIAALSLLLLLAATTALAHGGHLHNILGTVKSVQASQLVIEKNDGSEVTVLLTDATKVEKGGQPASRADLVAGTRVSVYVANDSKTAVTIKVAK